MKHSKDSTDQYAISSLWVDKSLIMPYFDKDLNSNGFPNDGKFWYKFKVQVIDATTHKIPTEPQNVYIQSNQNSGTLSYWLDDQKTKFDKDVQMQSPLQTDKKGQLTFYVGHIVYSYSDVLGIVFDLAVGLAPNPYQAQGGSTTRKQTMASFFYSPESIANLDQTALYPELKIPEWDETVKFPAWDPENINYSTAANLEVVDSTLTAQGNDIVVICVNGKRVNTGTGDFRWNQIQKDSQGIKIPYGMFIGNNGEDEDFNGRNYITYFEATVGAVSQPNVFTVGTSAGIPLQMPDSGMNTAPNLNAPIWYGAQYLPDQAPQEPLTWGNLEDPDNSATGDPGLDILVNYPSDVEPGDVYQLLVYVNGYQMTQENNKRTYHPITQIFGDGSTIPGYEANTNVFLTWVVSESEVTGDNPPMCHDAFIRADMLQKYWADPTKSNDKGIGMMWFQYIVNGSEYSPIYVSGTTPVQFNFSGSGINHMKQYSSLRNVPASSTTEKKDDGFDRK